jgi:hypothetical protein
MIKHGVSRLKKAPAGIHEDSPAVTARSSARQPEPHVFRLRFFESYCAECFIGTEHFDDGAEARRRAPAGIHEDSPAVTARGSAQQPDSHVFRLRFFESCCAECFIGTEHFDDGAEARRRAPAGIHEDFPAVTARGSARQPEPHVFRLRFFETCCAECFIGTEHCDEIKE